MKIGTQFPVTIQGIEVTMAYVEAVEDDQAVVVIPATRVVFGIKSSLDVATPEVDRVFAGEADNGKPVESDAIESRDGTFSISGEGSLRNMDLDSSAIDTNNETE